MSTTQKRNIDLREINMEHFQKQIDATKRIRAEREEVAKSLTRTCTYPGDISRCKWITTCQKCRFGVAARQVAKRGKPRARRNQKTEA